MSHTRRLPRCSVHVGPQLVEVLDVKAKTRSMSPASSGSAGGSGRRVTVLYCCTCEWAWSNHAHKWVGPALSFELALTNAALHFVCLCCALDHFSTRMSSPRCRSIHLSFSCCLVRNCWLQPLPLLP